MQVIVASKNPVKLEAVKKAFSEMFPQESFSYQTLAVDSGVADQPMDETEALRGATNRVQAAATQVPQADYWVGIEGGIHREGEDMYVCSHAVVRGKSGYMSKSRTGLFLLPRIVSEAIRSQMDLNQAIEEVFGETGSGQKMGAVGILTHQAIPRVRYAAEAVIFALIPFKNPELYPQD